MSQKKSAEKFVEHEVQALLELEKFIASNPDPRELKRAASIRMLIEGICRETIQKILGVSSPFISKWKINYALHGIQLEFRLSRSKSALALRLANSSQERQWSLVTSYQAQP